MIYRVSYELFTSKKILEKGYLKYLEKYNFAIIVPIFSEKIDKYTLELIRVCNEKGIVVDVLPWLPDKYGYWIHEGNLDILERYLRAALNTFRENKLEIEAFVIDLEMPITQHNWLSEARGIGEKLARYLAIIRHNRNKERFRRASKKLKEIIDMCHEHDIRVGAAALPLSLFAEDDFVEDILETPLSQQPWDMVGYMFYNSMTAGYSKFLTLKDARALSYRLGLMARKKVGNRLAAAIGVTYIGKLGDEPYYTDPRDLGIDAGIMKYLGITDITIYNFEGMVLKPDPDAWFRAVIDAKPIKPPMTLKALMVEFALKRLADFLRAAYY